MKYLLVLAFLIISTAASAQWGANRERALDRMERQHEGLQQLQMELWLQNRGDWSCDPIYGSAQSCRQMLQLPGPRYRRPPRGYYYDEDDDD